MPGRQRDQRAAGPACGCPWDMPGRALMVSSPAPQVPRLVWQQQHKRQAAPPAGRAAHAHGGQRARRDRQDGPARGLPAHAALSAHAAPGAAGEGGHPPGPGAHAGAPAGVFRGLQAKGLAARQGVCGSAWRRLAKAAHCGMHAAAVPCTLRPCTTWYLGAATHAGAPAGTFSGFEVKGFVAAGVTWQALAQALLCLLPSLHKG